MRTPEPMMCRRAAGFTMLEVLIAIVVIAFGLLGIAGLQAFALKNNQSASLRSTATILAGDMVDRMKANVQGSRDGFYNQPDTAAYATPVAACLTAVGCPAPQQLANHDLYEWAQLVAASLPNGVGVVCADTGDPNDGTIGNAQCANAADAPYVIKIWWVDDRTARNKAAAPQRFVTQFVR